MHAENIRILLCEITRNFPVIQNITISRNLPHINNKDRGIYLIHAHMNLYTL